MKTIIVTTLALALGGLACGKEEGAQKDPEAVPATATPTPEAGGATEPDPTATAADPAAGGDAGADTADATAASADVAPEAAAAAELPTREDFEEEAAKDVKKENLEAEVKRLEKELGVKNAAKAGTPK